MTPKASETLLRRALLANAGFSTLSACFCLALPEAVGSFMGLQSRDISALGMELAAFACGILLLLTRDLRQGWARNTVAAIIALDSLWVAASLVLLIGSNPLTSAGQWTVGIVAAVIADLAFFQWRGWRGSASGDEISTVAA